MNRTSKSKEQFENELLQLVDDDEFEPASSFRDDEYESEEMQNLLELEKPEEKIPSGLDDVEYRNTNIFPEWLLSDPQWIHTKNFNQSKSENAISDILHQPTNTRTHDQTTILVRWLMSVWETANTMGFKKCADMIKEFKYFKYESGENIITEGERGLTFYIIISGETAVIKDGIGEVAKLGKGKSFGEIALSGKDLRTATIRADTSVEVLSLHKVDYDHFVRDIQQAERRENYHLLRECKLFEKWSRVKIEKMANTCKRKNFEAGEFVFHQGDQPDSLYILYEGAINIIKEIHIICKNRWPTGVNAWDGCTKRVVKPFHMQTLSAKCSFFGELSIMRDTVRTASAVAVGRTTLLAIDRLEFLHMLDYNYRKSAEESAMEAVLEDEKILDKLGNIGGGPSSFASTGSMRIRSNADKRTKEKERQRYRKMSPKKTKGAAGAGGGGGDGEGGEDAGGADEEHGGDGAKKVPKSLSIIEEVRKQDEKKVLEAKMKQLSLQAQRIEKEQRERMEVLLANSIVVPKVVLNCKTLGKSKSIGFSSKSTTEESVEATLTSAGVLPPLSEGRGGGGGGGGGMEAEYGGGFGSEAMRASTGRIVFTPISRNLEKHSSTKFERNNNRDHLHAAVTVLEQVTPTGRRIKSSSITNLHDLTAESFGGGRGGSGRAKSPQQFSQFVRRPDSAAYDHNGNTHTNTNTAGSINGYDEGGGVAYGRSGREGAMRGQGPILTTAGGSAVDGYEGGGGGGGGGRANTSSRSARGSAGAAIGVGISVRTSTAPVGSTRLSSIASSLVNSGVVSVGSGADGSGSVSGGRSGGGGDRRGGSRGVRGGNSSAGYGGNDGYGDAEGYDRFDDRFDMAGDDDWEYSASEAYGGGDGGGGGGGGAVVNGRMSESAANGQSSRRASQKSVKEMPSLLHKAKLSYKDVIGELFVGKK